MSPIKLTNFNKLFMSIHHCGLQVYSLCLMDQNQRYYFYQGTSNMTINTLLTPRPRNN